MKQLFILMPRVVLIFLKIDDEQNYNTEKR